MKEFENTFRDGLNKGLRRQDDNPRNNESLLVCQNVRCGALGLRPLRLLTSNIDAVVGLWPQPQLLSGRGFTLIACDSNLYLVEADGSLTFKVDIASTGIVDLLDYGDFALVVGDSDIIYRNPATEAYASWGTGDTRPRFTTACDYKGQIVAGNIKTDWHGCGSNSVIWSDIGSDSFLPTRRNTAGFRPMPWQGEVLRIKRLGDAVIVYGDNGIAALLPVQSPVATYGLKEILSFGIKYKGAVGGSLNEHLFVDILGWVWKMGTDLVPKNLGYKEFVASMGDVVVSYHPTEEEYYISDGDIGYLLTKQGLSETFQMPTSIVVADSKLEGMFVENADQSFLLTTDLIDFGIRGKKTLEVIELGVDASADVYVSVYWRSDIKKDFSQSHWVLLNPSGVVTMKVTAEEFKVSIKSATADAQLDYLKLRWKLVDKRAIRGMYNAT